MNSAMMQVSEFKDLIVLSTIKTICELTGLNLSTLGSYAIYHLNWQSIITRSIENKSKKQILYSYALMLESKSKLPTRFALFSSSLFSSEFVIESLANEFDSSEILLTKGTSTDSYYSFWVVAFSRSFFNPLN